MATPLPSKPEADKQSIPAMNPDHAPEPAGLTFFDLPPEIRDRIYDLVAEPDAAVHKDLPAWAPHVPVNSKRSKLDQVSRQFRAEFLPRWHRRIGLHFFVPTLGGYRLDRGYPKQQRWLATFGATRVPMTRRFVFSGWPGFNILLRGGRHDLGGADVKLSDEYAHKWDRLWREITEDVEQFVGSLLKRHAGAVYLTKEDVAKIGVYLEQLHRERHLEVYYDPGVHGGSWD